MKKYETTNLYESSFLLAKGFKLLGKASHGSKSSLQFQDTADLRKAVMDFYNGDGVVSAKAFVDYYRSMKDLCFQR